MINSSRYYLNRFLKEAASSLPSGSTVLDAGAGDCRYRSLFAHTNYESADFCRIEKTYGGLTYVCDLKSLPVEDCRYDAVVCTQVLEHLPEPVDVLKEFHRVLKPAGVLFLTVPFYYEEHEMPFDFFRYTQFGLRAVLESAGFAICRLEWLEGYYGTLSYQLNKAADSLTVHPHDYGGGAAGVAAAVMAAFLKPVFRIASLFFSLLDMRWKQCKLGHNKNFIVIARKK